MSIDLRTYIRDVPDFPIPGILFRDITPLLGEPKAFQFVLEQFEEQCKTLKVEAVVGIESRGFIFGAPLADRLGVPFVPVRKAGKLPAHRMSVEYSLEYGVSQIDIHSDGLRKGQSVVIVDDLLATGGTARACTKLVELLGARVAALIFLIELEGLNGRKLLSEYESLALIKY